MCNIIVNVDETVQFSNSYRDDKDIWDQLVFLIRVYSFGGFIYFPLLTSLRGPWKIARDVYWMSPSALLLRNFKNPSWKFKIFGKNGFKNFRNARGKNEHLLGGPTG